MNSIHDMGGMAGFGPVKREENEPVFHDDWERRIFAMNMLSLGVAGPVDRARHSTEALDPALYLRLSYYEKWLIGMENRLKESGLITEQEIRKGQSESNPELPHPVPDAEAIAHFVGLGDPSVREGADRQAVFKAGDRVRVRNIHPAGHTRAPRYIRGRTGTITIHYGNHIFPDTHAHHQGENPQPLYNVSFNAGELWGSDVNQNDTVCIDLWEDYLEPLEK